MPPLQKLALYSYSQSQPYIQIVGISRGDGTEDIPGRDTVEVGDDNIRLARPRSIGVKNTVKKDIRQAEEVHGINHRPIVRVDVVLLGDLRSSPRDNVEHLST